METLDLPDGRKVRITKRASETIDHDDCPFCLGRAAAHRGDGEDCNPFPKPDIDIRESRAAWYETDHGLWLAGHGVGLIEPGGLLWYENPTLDLRWPPVRGRHSLIVSEDAARQDISDHLDHIAAIMGIGRQAAKVYVTDDGIGGMAARIAAFVRSSTLLQNDAAAAEDPTQPRTADKVAPLTLGQKRPRRGRRRRGPI